MPVTLPPAIICTAPRAIDGDTLACANLARHVRLAGIDAPELPGHCRRGRICTPGNGEASKRALAQLLTLRPVRVELAGNGGYGRIAGIVWAGGLNVNCALIRQRRAVRRYRAIRCLVPPAG